MVFICWSYHTEGLFAPNFKSSIYVTQDHAHVVWSTNRTYNNNKKMAHGMAEVQQMLLKPQVYK